MIRVHRIFRWQNRKLPEPVREVEPGDTERSAIVGRYAHLDFFALRMHHETEDMVLWDRLVARGPACALHVGQMRAQHAEVAVRLSGIEPRLGHWVATADPLLRDAFPADIESLRDLLSAHLGQEEDDILFLPW